MTATRSKRTFGSKWHLRPKCHPDQSPNQELQKFERVRQKMREVIKLVPADWYPWHSRRR